MAISVAEGKKAKRLESDSGEKKEGFKSFIYSGSWIFNEVPRENFSIKHRKKNYFKTFTFKPICDAEVVSK